MSIHYIQPIARLYLAVGLDCTHDFELYRIVPHCTVLLCTVYVLNCKLILTILDQNPEMYSVKCAVQCTVHITQDTVYSALQCHLYTVYCTL